MFDQLTKWGLVSVVIIHWLLENSMTITLKEAPAYRDNITSCINPFKSILY